MASSNEHIASHAERDTRCYVVPTCPEIASRSEQLGKRLEDAAEMLDTFFAPDLSANHWQMPFGRFGDTTLNVVTAREENLTLVALGHIAHDGDERAGFYASGSPASQEWLANGDRRLSPRVLAKTLDANWPTLAIDNTKIRELLKKGDEITFQNIFDLIHPTTRSHGEEVTRTHTFTHTSRWPDAGRTSTVHVALTKSHENNAPPVYALEVTLPYRRSRRDRVHVTCLARLDPQLGISFEIDTQDPEIQPDISINAMIDALELYLEKLIHAKVAKSTATLDIDSLRS